jgi:hypothetical protein
VIFRLIGAGEALAIVKSGENRPRETPNNVGDGDGLGAEA